MNYNKKTVYDVDVKGKKVLLRCDFNVPQDKKTAEAKDAGQKAAPQDSQKVTQPEHK